MDEWALVIARTVPLVVWTLVLRVAPAAIRAVESRPEQRLRRLLAVWLVEGACIALFAGGLANAGFITGDVSRLIYTMFGAVVAIVGIVLLWTYWPERDGRL